MEYELGIVLREQQAFLSMLSRRLAKADGEERRTAFDAFAHALVAPVAMWRYVLLPLAGDTQLAQQVAASGRSAVGHVVRIRIDQQGVAADNDILTLTTSSRSLLAQESALLKSTFSALTRSTQLALADEAERELIRLGGTAELDELHSPLADRRRGARHRPSRRPVTGHLQTFGTDALTSSAFGTKIP